MTSERRTDHDLSALLAELYLESAPSYRFDVLAQTSRMRQRLRWTFAERWLPAALVRQRAGAPALSMRAVLIVAALLLLVLGLIVLQAATRPPIPPPFGIARNGEIVYAIDGDVYVRDAVDSPARLLIGSPGRDFRARVLPARRQVRLPGRRRRRPVTSTSPMRTARMSVVSVARSWTSTPGM